MDTRFLFAQLDNLVAGAPREDLPVLVGQLEAAKAAAWARLSVPAPATAVETKGDGNISAEEAARRLGVSRSWIYKNARALPFTVRIGRRLVCSIPGLERWNKGRHHA